MAILLPILLVICLIAYIWLAVVMFKRHVLWGLVFVSPVIVGIVGGVIASPMLLIVSNGLGLVAFLVGILFAIMNWSVARNSFLLYLVSSIAIVGVLTVEVVSLMSEPELVAIQEQLANGQISDLEANQQMQAVIQQKLIQRYTGQPTRTLSEEDLLTDEERAIQALRDELAQKNAAAIESQRYAEEQERKREALLERKPELRKVRVFKSITVDEARNHVGEKIRIVSFEGVERQGVLLSAGFDRLVIERQLAGGKFKFQALNKDVKVIEVETTELR